MELEAGTEQNQWCRTTFGDGVKTTFTWTIENFQNRQEKYGEKITSSPFFVTDSDNRVTKWCYEVYPKGLRGLGDDRKDYKEGIGVFLVNKNKFPVTASWDGCIHYEKNAMETDKMHMRRVSPSETNGGQVHGFPDIIKHSELTDSLLPNGDLTLVFEVTVYGKGKTESGSKDSDIKNSTLEEQGRKQLLKEASRLSVVGIIVSIIGSIGFVAAMVFMFGGIGDILMKILENARYQEIVGALLVLLIIQYLTLPMWILLKIKTANKDIFGIEKILTIYSYVSGALEIIVPLTLSIISFRIWLIVLSAVYIFFACLKIHGVRVEKNELLYAYIGFRILLLIIYAITFFVLLFMAYGVVTFCTLIFGVFHFKLDLRLNWILFDIRVDRKSTARRAEDNI